MKSSSLSTRFAVLALCGAAAAATPAWASSYSLVSFSNLGLMEGKSDFTVGGVNDAGQVVGTSDADGQGTRRAVLWQSGSFTLLDAPYPGNASGATAINAGGQVVGSSVTPSGPQHAVSWGPNGTATDLGVMPGYPYSNATAINNAGQVVGDSHVGIYSPSFRATYWNGNATVSLGTLGGVASHATGINNASQDGNGPAISGYSLLADNTTTHATVWQNGVLKDLGTLGGTTSYAYGVNDAGWTVGEAFISGDQGDHAALWRDGQVVDLGASLVGSIYSAANAVNNKGLVGGTSMLSNYQNHALIWDTADGTVLDLNSFLDPSQVEAGMELLSVGSLSDNGWVAGLGSNVNTGELFAFAMQISSVPEPGSLGLMLSGMAGIAACRQRAARRRS
jgi:probable HAF family extracellular repeat protein